MPRRGGNSGGGSGKRRRPQADRWAEPMIATGRLNGRVNGLVQKSKRPPLVDMVKPTGTCPTGKIRYGTPDDARDALARALINRELLHSVVVEDRWYPQAGDKPCECRGYHLTSKPKRRPQ